MPGFGQIYLLVSEPGYTKLHIPAGHLKKIMKVASVFLGAFVAATLGVPLDHVVHETREATTAVLEQLSAPAADTIVPVRIALKQRNLENGMQYLLAV